MFHAWLHVPDYIENSGPLPCFWCWVCERSCGRFARSISSRKHPFASLNRRALEQRSLEAIINQYDLQDTLPVYSNMHNSGAMATFTSPLYPKIRLLHPFKIVPFTSPRIGHLKRRITSFLADELRSTKAVVKSFLPATFLQYGRVEVERSIITSHITAAATEENRRDSTFVEYVIERPGVVLTRFGQLERVMVVRLPAADALGLTQATDFILCDIRNCPARQDRNGFWDYVNWGVYEVVSGVSLRDLVGRIRDRGRWTIIRRSGGIRNTQHQREDDDEE